MAVKLKHAPQRTCVACRTTSAKREFVRIVRTPAGSIEVDPSAKAPGRGAYICASPACWTEAIKRDRLAHALRATISPADREALELHANQLATGVTD